MTGKKELWAGRRPLPALAGLLALMVFLAACQDTEQVLREFFRDPSPHEAYELSLSRAGLAETALGMEWYGAARSALVDAPLVEPPFREEAYFPPDDPMALGYRIRLEQGQRLQVAVTLEGAGATRVFVDLFRVPPDASRPPIAITHSPEDSTALGFEARRPADYLVRVHPELLRGGRLQVELDVDPSLAFPVSGSDTRDIQSFFGDPREAGRRTHHGVDIFAPRGTPVVAATDGRVRVGTSNLGGNVVWLRDGARSRSIYYAHLERQLVENGQSVQRGDTLGEVGNSGNARSTPPHLHFGIYQRGEGPQNPWYFLFDPGDEPPVLAVDRERIGRWARGITEGLRLRDSPGREAAVLDELPLSTAVRVVAGSGDWIRVRLPDGRTGYLAARLTEGTDRPLDTRVARGTQAVRAGPGPEAPVVMTLEAGSGFEVLGTFGQYLYVRPREGRTGWMATG